MEFKSTNGMFTISVSDENQRNKDEKSNEAIEIKLRCLENTVSLRDLAETIFDDLFCSKELDLEEKTIEAEVTEANGESRLFMMNLKIDYQVSMDNVLLVIAEQWLI